LPPQKNNLLVIQLDSNQEDSEARNSPGDPYFSGGDNSHDITAQSFKLHVIMHYGGVFCLIVLKSEGRYAKDGQTFFKHFSFLLHLW